ncbi:hypothetical protein [Massilia aquatica]|uniref:Uncharacterized protein n=1 Tax=Massilia aquatica TaxID=2609000 RepID=A0ABX0MPC1_9BURK|nr:hypothetical protein [Massilia aquatica]NHZ44046.1 hypothetical protein [Massilia aquatica]
MRTRSPMPCCLVGLCYGAYALADAGLLDGKSASPHWTADSDFSARFPRVNRDMNALDVEQDKRITSAGAVHSGENTATALERTRSNDQ